MGPSRNLEEMTKNTPANKPTECHRGGQVRRNEVYPGQRQILTSILSAIPRPRVSLRHGVAHVFLALAVLVPNALEGQLQCGSYKPEAVISGSSGIELYKKEAQCAGCEDDYILAVDLNTAELQLLLGPVRRQEPCCPFDDQSCTPSPDCPDRGSFGGPSPEFFSIPIEEGRTSEGLVPAAISSAAFGGRFPANYEYGQLTFSLRLGSGLVTAGYADPLGLFPEQQIENHRVLCIDNHKDFAEVCPYFRVDTTGSSGCPERCPIELLSFSKDFLPGGAVLRPRTFGASADTDGDGSKETILIYTSLSASPDYAHQQLLSCGASDSIQLDGGGSSQLRVKSRDFIGSSRDLWNYVGFFSSEAGFSDVPDNEWYAPYLKYAAPKGIVGGFPDNTFKPEREATRAEVLKIAYKAAGEHVNQSASSTFIDVNSDDWFYPYVADAEVEEFVEGVRCVQIGDEYIESPESNSFCFFPDRFITRAEAVKTCSEVFRVDESHPGLLATHPPVEFNDLPAMGSEISWAHKYVSWMTRASLDSVESVPDSIPRAMVLEGYSSSHFRPLNHINRAEIVKIASSLRILCRIDAGGNLCPELSGIEARTEGTQGAALSSVGRFFDQDIDDTNIGAPEQLVGVGAPPQPVSGPITLSGSSEDGDGDALTYFWSASKGSFSAIDQARFTEVVWQPPDVAKDTVHTVVAISGDGRGLVVHSELKFLVLASSGNSLPSGSITSPTGTQTGTVTVIANATDADGLARLTVSFVNGGSEAVLCGSGSSTSCSGTSGTFSASNVDPAAFGASAGNVTLRLFVEDTTGAKEQVDTSDFTYDPPVTGPGYTLTVLKQGDGDGTILGSLNCPPGCTSTSVTIPDGENFTLSGTADGSSTWIGFAGDLCFGTATCSFPLFGDRTIRASFGLPDALTVLYTFPVSGDTTYTNDPMFFLNRPVSLGSNSGNITYRRSDGTDISFTPIVSQFGTPIRHRLYLQSDATLERGATYIATIPAGAVVDDNGSELPLPHTIEWTLPLADQPPMYLSRYPYRVMENDSVRLSVWFQEPEATNRTITIGSTPGGLLDHPSSVVLPAGQTLVEIDIDTEVTPADLTDTAASLQIGSSGFGQESATVLISNGTPASYSQVRWQAGVVIDEDGVLEAGENAEYRFDVANQGSSSEYVILYFRVLNASTGDLRILGGSGGQFCHLANINPGRNGNCTRTLLTDEELPTGTYYIEVEAKNQSGQVLFLDQARVPVMNSVLPDYTVSLGFVTSNALDPGTEIDLEVNTRNSSDGFDLRMVPFQVLIEVEGVEQVLYDTYSDVRGHFTSFHQFELPVVAPSVPGEHRIWARINPPGPGQIPELNFSNNESEMKILRVAGPERPPVLDPIPSPITVVAGTALSLEVTAQDENGDNLTFALTNPPAGATVTSTGPQSAVFNWSSAADFPAGAWDVTVTVSDGTPETSDDQQVVRLVVEHQADLLAVIDDGLALAVPGQPTGYTLTVTNNGPSMASGANVQAAFPQLTDVLWCAGSACTPTQIGDLIDAVTVGPAESKIYEIQGRIAAGATGSIIQTATVSAGASSTDPDPTNNQGSDTTTLRDLDFGDAPDTALGPPWAYPTKLADNGARHGIVPGLHLGAVVDGEVDGQPSLAADGDNLSGAADEDGVIVLTALTPCQTADLEVVAASAGLLDAWIDFNTAGDWVDAGEQVVTSLALVAGTNSLSISVPCGATPGAVAFARFRFSSSGGLAFSGLALDGEVEDYAFPVAQTFKNLVVTKIGAGTGTVIASPNGINCGDDCSEAYPTGTPIVLSTTPAAGSEFIEWGGDCSGSGNCPLVMDSDKQVTARFEPRDYELTVEVDGNGTVLSSPAAISCQPTCSATFTYGEVVTLTATPGTGSHFIGWDDPNCPGTDSCAVTVTADTTITATFERNRYLLTVIVDGAGTIVSDPAGIACEPECTAEFDHGTEVTLTPIAEPVSSFVSWDLAACPDSDPCTFILEGALTITGTFEPSDYELAVERTGAGNGRVVSATAGIDCGNDCTESYPYQAAVSLSALAGVGSKFSVWSGGGCVRTETCELSMEADVTISADFAISCVDEIENGTVNWNTATGPNDGGGTTPWVVTSSDSYSPTQSWFASEEDQVKDQLLVAAFSTPLVDTGATLQFWQRYETEAGFDGGVLEYSVDGAISWFDILDGDGAAIPANSARFVSEPYNSSLDVCCANPLAGRQAWSGISSGWVNTIVDLSDLAGHSVRFRWRMGSDDAVSDGLGWWVDDVVILDAAVCPLGLLFHDGFESGDTTFWSSTEQ